VYNGLPRYLDPEIERMHRGVARWQYYQYVGWQEGEVVGIGGS